MEEDRQHRYYPRKGRPEIILENGSGVQITAQPLNQKVESARIRFAAEEVCLLTKEMFPRYEISPVYLCRKETSDRLVSDGNDRYQSRTYQSPEHGKGVSGTADIHVSGQSIREVEEHRTAEFQNIQGERGLGRWNGLTKKM